jgi:hypothetical protein
VALWVGLILLAGAGIGLKLFVPGLRAALGAVAVGFCVLPLATLPRRVGQPTKSAQPTVFKVGCASQTRLTHPTESPTV